MSETKAKSVRIVLWLSQSIHYGPDGTIYLVKVKPPAVEAGT